MFNVNNKFNIDDTSSMKSSSFLLQLASNRIINSHNNNIKCFIELYY